MADDRPDASSETCNLHGDELRAHLETMLVERFHEGLAFGEDAYVYTVMTPHWPDVL